MMREVLTYQDSLLNQCKRYDHKTGAGVQFPLKKERKRCFFQSQMRKMMFFSVL